jgi:CubicO group peptidase (beta-lactamase class C family)
MRLYPLVAVALVSATPVAATAAEVDIAQTLDGIFAPWASSTTPGCAAGVAMGGTVVSRAYGMADLGHGIANTPETRFEAGSVSKQFVAASVLMLVEEGKIALGDDIRKYLPEIPDYGAPITIDHLLSHTSGLRDWGFAMEIADWSRSTRAYTNDDVLAFVARQKSLNYAPGTDYSYTNTGYVLLAMIVERAAGQPLADFTRTRIFDPLGMKSTGWRTNFRQIEKMRATAYIGFKNGYVEKMPFEDVYGDAGVLTTVGDLLIWNDALAQGRLGRFVGRALVENAHLRDGRKLTYARGLEVPKNGRYGEISHGGAIGGYRAWLGRFPEKDLSIAVLCNAGEADGVGVGRGIELGRKIASALLPAQSVADTRSAVPATQDQTGTQVGLFASDKTGLPLTIVSDGVGLRLKDGAALEQYARSHYRLAGSDIIFDSQGNFRRDKSDGTTETYRHVAPQGREDGDFSGLTGRYVSDEIEATYVVESSPKGLRLKLVERPAYVIDLESAYRNAWVYDTRMGKRTAIVRFERDRTGKVVSLSIGWNARVRAMRFDKIAN